jgi:hypothetical protein
LDFWAIYDDDVVAVLGRRNRFMWSLPVAASLAACWSESPRQPVVEPAPVPTTAAHDPPFGDAQVELRTGAGGVVSLHGNRSSAMKRADVLMAQHCGEGAFTIVREGEEVIESASVTTQWRVHYECNRR